MRRAFTLIELLAVIGIVGMLGVAAAASYGALVTGMRDRSACAAATAVLREACERARIDRLPTVVYCYNVCLKESKADDPGRVVGLMTAIRRVGRITQVKWNPLTSETPAIPRLIPDCRGWAGLVWARWGPRVPCVTDLGPENCAWGPSGICTVFLRPAPLPPQRAMLGERAPDLPPTPQPEVETGHSLSKHVVHFQHPRSVLGDYLCPLPGRETLQVPGPPGWGTGRLACDGAHPSLAPDHLCH